MNKKIVALFLSLTIALSGNVSAFAAEIGDKSDTVETENVESAEEELDISSNSEDATATENVQEDSQLDTVSEAEMVQSETDEAVGDEQANDSSKADQNDAKKIVVESTDAVKKYASETPTAVKSINVNTKYYGTLSTSNKIDSYKFTLNKAGHIRIDFGKEYESNSSKGWYVKVYNKNWEVIKCDTFYCGNSKTDKSSELGLNSGVYYISVLPISTSSGLYWTDVKYNLVVAFSEDNNWEKEINDTFETANIVKTNNKYYGSISDADSMDGDYYRFTLTSPGHIRLDFGKEYESNSSKGWEVYLYNAEQEEMISWTFHCGNSKTDSTLEYGLNKGNYYIFVKGIANSNGYLKSDVAYSFKVNYIASNVWEREPNDDLSTPNTIAVNTVYYGTTNQNDDCYKFELSRNGTVSIDFGKEYDEDTRKGWEITLYNTDREKISSATINCGDTKVATVIETNLVLGTYYLKISPLFNTWHNCNSEVTYNIKVTAKNEPTPSTTTVSAVAGLKIGGRAGDALRLNWNKNTSADGYIVEQYKSGSWTRIARIGSNSTVTYRVEKLSPSTKYNFRVKAFKLNGNAATYSSYKNISGITNPATISGLKIGGHAADALRLNWTKNSKASGYIVEQYKGGKWTRIARIGENSTTTYRVEKLSASTTYKFRVQAFGFDGKTALYGNYAYINGKTSPATVTGIRIGGTAKDALRVNWNKDSKASGYIVQQYKNGTWVRIARIGNNNTTTYRVSGLKSGSTYIFRVQAFGYDGKTAIYGGFAMIPGTTK